jgi:hypothetical protein
MTEDFEIDGRTWVDKTTYQKGQDSSNKKSNMFATNIGDECLMIIYGHLNYPGKWIFNYRPLGLHQVRLKAQTKEEAAKEAIEICLKTIEELKKGFEVEKTKTTT